MKFPFLDPDQPLAVRVNDLVSRLTLPEKIAQLMHDNPAVERLGVPAYNWWSEACHGVGRNGRATVFPQVIGLGATWNRELVRRIATAISDEARAKHHIAANAGMRGLYQGLTFWTPNVNIFRDPRWGRGQETFGEDPFLTGELGLAMVKGLQGDDPKYLKVAACAKHFAVHSGPEDERHSFDARPTPKDMAETYLPAFEKLVRAGNVEAVMGAYNRVYGEPACGSRKLLGEILRDQWDFKGHVVSDCGAIDDFHHHHGVTKNAAESAALAVKNGCDLNCGCTYNDLTVAVREKLISESDIDVSLKRLLTTKFKLGLFDPAERVSFTSIPASVVECPEHRALARQAAVESIVLLKNSADVLPLRPDVASLLVVGPTAANIGALLGNYYGVSANLVTIMQGIVERAAPASRVKYRPGCPISQPGAPGVNYTFPAAAGSEVVVAVMGLDHTLEGEEGDAVASSVGGDRPMIELPENQRIFLKELRKHSKKLILVITGGSALAIPEEFDYCDAVLQVWYPGCEGGRAVADVLFGDASPSGKMPLTVPRSTADLPTFNDYSMAGRTYRFAEREPLFPFGFGLGYGKVRFEQLELGADTLKAGDSLKVHLKVQNVGNRPALETVQCYLQAPRTIAGAPYASLIDFKKVSLKAGGSAEVEFNLAAEAFKQVDEQGNRVWLPGRYTLVVGAASPGARAEALGAPKPATASLTVA
ncbi:MAG: glycoside hydrolase family 3 N-terminal domain-containing protein [Nibricoccus sp.]